MSSPDDSTGFSPSRRQVLAGAAGALGAAGTVPSVTADSLVSGTGEATTDGSEPAVDVAPTEARPVFVHPRWYWDAGTDQQRRLSMQKWLDRADQANVNVLFAWVESKELAAMLGEPGYVDHYDFWDPDGWDAMGTLVQEAERRGIGVHFWYSFTRYKRPRKWVPEYDPQLEVLPDGDPSWAAVHKNEYEAGHTNSSDAGVSGLSLCANESGTHEWTLEALSQVFEQYPRLRGLHVEEPGYLDLGRCVCERCQDVYADMYDTDGENLLDHVHDTTEEYYFDDTAVPVKTAGTDAFVERLVDWWDHGTLSYSGSYSAKWDRVRGRNWGEWAERGLVPYYLPQSYGETVGRFETEAKMAMDTLSGTETSALPLVGIEWSNGSNDASTVARQVEAARELDGYADVPVVGVGVFSGAHFTNDVVAALRTGPFFQAATPPWREPGALSAAGVGTPDTPADGSVPAVRDGDWTTADLPGAKDW